MSAVSLGIFEGCLVICPAGHPWPEDFPFIFISFHSAGGWRACESEASCIATLCGQLRPIPDTHSFFLSFSLYLLTTYYSRRRRRNAARLGSSKTMSLSFVSVLLPGRDPPHPSFPFVLTLFHRYPLGPTNLCFEQRRPPRQLPVA